MTKLLLRMQNHTLAVPALATDESVKYCISEVEVKLKIKVIEQGASSLRWQVYYFMANLLETLQVCKSHRRSVPKSLSRAVFLCHVLPSVGLLFPW